MGFWQEVVIDKSREMFSQILSKSLRGIFCALQSRDRKRGAHQSNKGFLVATSELKKVSRHVVCSTH